MRVIRPTAGEPEAVSRGRLIQCPEASWQSEAQEEGSPWPVPEPCQVPKKRIERTAFSPASTLFRAEGKEFWSEAEGDKSCSVSESIMEQINGSVQMESALLYTFLEVSSDCKFREQLHSLQSQGIVPFVKGSYCYDDEVELQTDGNRSGHLQNGELVFAPEVNEEVVRIIAAQLAEIGDQFDKEIQARVVNDLVQHFLNENLSGEDITRLLSEAVEGLAQAIPLGMEQEKAMLVLAMVLTKKIANTMPSLLQRAFSTTVNYISRQLHNYIVRMLRE
ncbi:BH3-interacting domain death agonist isoform 2-T2 [Theristicus caerulescens]